MINMCSKRKYENKNYLILYINNGVGRGVRPMSLFNMKTINGLIYEFNIKNKRCLTQKQKERKKKENNLIEF